MAQNQDFPYSIQSDGEILPIKSRRLLKTLKERQSVFKFYNWDLLENYAYITYLTNFRYIFDSEAERKRVKVFTHLSTLIKTRNPPQIKSHHQKMMLRHESVDSIIEHLRIKITKQLNLKPELFPVIQKINKQAQQFFLNEVAIRNSIKKKNCQPRKLKRHEKKRISQKSQETQIKLEEGSPDELYSEVKHQQTIVVPSDYTCLKEQDSDNMILRIQK